MKALVAALRMLTFVGGVVCGLLARELLFSAHDERRFLLYAIHRGLQVGMTFGQLQELVANHDAPYLIKSGQAQGLLRVDLGSARSCLLSIEMVSGRVTHARLRSENGPTEHCVEAPPDL
jgi:hypothetical protein